MERFTHRGQYCKIFELDAKFSKQSSKAEKYIKVELQLNIHASLIVLSKENSNFKTIG